MNSLPILAAGAEASPSIVPTLLIYGALFAFMWFVLIRPQRKKRQKKETESLQSAVKTGDPVLLHSGMFGKVVDTINDVLIVELGTNKSVRVPVQRSGVASIVEPDLSIVKDSDDE